MQFSDIGRSYAGRSVVFRSGFSVLSASICQPLVVHRRHEGDEALKRFAFDAVSSSVGVQGGKAYRRLTAKSAVLTIALKQVPGTEVEGVPWFGFRLRRRSFDKLYEPGLIVTGANELREPFLLFRGVRLPP